MAHETGKTYNTINRSLEITGESWRIGSHELKNYLIKKFQKVLLHLPPSISMSYEDFIEGIKPKLPVKEALLLMM
jgi:hypothetical protein